MNWESLWQRSNGPRYAAFTDIDNTFFRPDCASDLWRLVELLRERDMPSVAVTGARHNSVLRRIQSGELPPFAAVASAVGTEIRVLTGAGTYQDDLSWQARMLATGFDLEHGAVLALRDLVESLRVDHPEWGVVLQGGDPQQFKFSLHFRAHTTEEAQGIFACLSGPCSAFRTVWCQDINFSTQVGEKKRYCFDVLAADKRDAVDYLAAEMRLDGGLVAGDSGNDSSMILESSDKLLGVVVGGSRPELLETVCAFQKAQASGGNMRWLFVEDNPARLGPQTLLAVVERYF